MLATPGLSAGSAFAPPVKAKSIATIGTAASRTSQALMPPGLTIASILLAAGAAPAKASVKAAASAAPKSLLTISSPRAAPSLTR